MFAVKGTIPPEMKNHAIINATSFFLVPQMLFSFATTVKIYDLKSCLNYVFTFRFILEICTTV